MAKPIYGYLVAAARRVWGWSPEVQAFRKTPQICANCGDKAKKNPKKGEKFHKDHIDPVGKAPRSFDGWDQYYKRMFVPVEHLQWLCQPCHKHKSKEERRKGAYK